MSEYYEMMDEMEKAGVQEEYINGWAAGFLGNPEREEQKVTEAYEAGYGDGKEQKRDGYRAWLQPT